MKNLILDGTSLTLEDVYGTATSPTTLSIDARAKRRMQASRDVVEALPHS